jgi:hypothetical protein
LVLWFDSFHRKEEDVEVVLLGDLEEPGKDRDSTTTGDWRRTTWPEQG